MSAKSGHSSPAAPRDPPTHPAQANIARPKPAPGGADIDTSHAGTRQDKIDKSGPDHPPTQQPTAQPGVGRRYAGSHVLILAQDLNIQIVGLNTGELLQELTLYTSRDY